MRLTIEFSSDFLNPCAHFSHSNSATALVGSKTMASYLLWSASTHEFGKMTGMAGCFARSGFFQKTVSGPVPLYQKMLNHTVASSSSHFKSFQVISSHFKL